MTIYFMYTACMHTGMVANVERHLICKHLACFIFLVSVTGNTVKPLSLYSGHPWDVANWLLYRPVTLGM